ncbi:TPA: hypothetical protein DDW35_13870 [Candidatus Sumerlaeota bacterium]|nr:hypothetical protein [Candidatus Sumerlaeota bacterium]
MASSGYSIPSEQVSQARETLLAQYRSRLAEESSRRAQNPIIDVEAQGSTRTQAATATVSTTVTSSSESTESSLNLRHSSDFSQFDRSMMQKTETDDGAALYKPPTASTPQVSTTASPQQRGVFVDVTV